MLRLLWHIGGRGAGDLPEERRSCQAGLAGPQCQGRGSQGLIHRRMPDITNLVKNTEQSTEIMSAVRQIIYYRWSVWFLFSLLILDFQCCWSRIIGCDDLAKICWSSYETKVWSHRVENKTIMVWGQQLGARDLGGDEAMKPFLNWMQITGCVAICVTWETLIKFKTRSSNESPVVCCRVIITGGSLPLHN